MGVKRYTPEEIVIKLRQVEVLVGQGMARIDAIKPLSPYLFKTRKGEPYLKPDKTAEGFTSIWQRWQNKMPEDKLFAERSIRNWVGDQDDLQTASERLGHASTDTTSKHYRSNVTKVMPLVSYKK